MKSISNDLLQLGGDLYIANRGGIGTVEIDYPEINQLLNVPYVQGFESIVIPEDEE